MSFAPWKPNLPTTQRFFSMHEKPFSARIYNGVKKMG